jgi:hypothetical protein
VRHEAATLFCDRANGQLLILSSLHAKVGRSVAAIVLLGGLSCSVPPTAGADGSMTINAAVPSTTPPTPTTVPAATGISIGSGAAGPTGSGGALASTGARIGLGLSAGSGLIATGWALVSLSRRRHQRALVARSDV